ncbi:MAG: hypothetical protein KDJ24_11065 [Gammaproteobacteria bacterium]|nr:hypothetical protein [Gammaproteobacteria bacterium]
MISTRIAVLLPTLMLGACVSQHDAMVAKGYPADYADGFDDGCHSGHKAGGNLFDEFRKDVERFARDDRYAQGWSDGFRQCESEQEALDRQTRMALQRQRLIEAQEQRHERDTRHLEREVLKGVDTRGLEILK